MQCSSAPRPGSKTVKPIVYWSIIENRRTRGNPVIQRQVLYLGEINGSPRDAMVQNDRGFPEG